MNILIIIGTLNQGGGERQAINDANNLFKKGYNVSIAFAQRGPLESLIDPKIEKIKLCCLNKFIVSFHILFLFIKERFDIIHAHMFWSERVVAIPAFLTGHKIVFNEHGLGLWRNKFHRTTMQLIALFADKIICSCNEGKKIRIVKEKIPLRKLVVVENSYEFIGYNVPKLNSVRNNRFIIGFVGRFNEVKRIETFIKLCELLKDKILNIQFILVGDGPERSKIINEIEEKNLIKYFRLPGFTQNTEVFYKSFDLFVLPSRIEAASLALIEAGFFGLPLIAFNVGGNYEIIQNNKNGYLIEDYNINEMRDRIYFLNKNRDIKLKMGNYSSVLIHEKYSSERRIKSLLQIYELM